MTWEWLTSSGIVLFQLLTLITLGGMIIFLQRRLYILDRGLAAERQRAIDELKRTADALAQQTKQIAEDVKADDDRRAARVRADVDRLASLFDRVGTRQDEVQASVRSVEEVVHRELDRPDSSKTTREQIDDIHNTTQAIAEKLKDDDAHS